MASDFEARLKEAAEAWLIQRFPSYKLDKSVLDIDVEVFAAGARWAYEEGRKAGLEEAAKIADREAGAASVSSLKHNPQTGNRMADAALFASEYIALNIRALLDKKPGKGGA